MRMFVSKMLFFIALPLLYCSMCFLLNCYFCSSETVPLDNKRILIVGDSHTQYSLDPTHFQSAQNISQSAEPLILTFWKLKKIFKTFTPDTIILGCGPHNISQFNDFKFSDKVWSEEMFRRSYPIENFKAIDSQISIDYLGFYKIFLSHSVKYPKTSHINYIGKYTGSFRSDVSEWETTVNRHYHRDEDILKPSEIQIQYLDSIIDLCASQNTKLVLVSSPVHKLYYDRIPMEILSTFARIKENYKAVTIIYDKTNEIYPDSLMADADHLNYYGARKFSSDLISFLK